MGNNPWAWIGLCLIVTLVVGINVALLNAFRGKGKDRSGLGHVLSSLDQARKQRQAQEEQYAELSRRVAELRKRDGGGSSGTDGE